MMGLLGSSDWRSLRPSLLQPGGRETSPFRLELNSSFLEIGVVMISDLQLKQYAANENPMLDEGRSWWTERTSGSGLRHSGGLHWTARLCGRHSHFYRQSAIACDGAFEPVSRVGVASFAGGIVCLFAKPASYAVFYPLLLIGLLCTVIPLGLRRSIRKTLRGS